MLYNSLSLELQGFHTVYHQVPNLFEFYINKFLFEVGKTRKTTFTSFNLCRGICSFIYYKS